MDAAELRRLIDGARSAQHVAGACSFDLRAPSQHEISVAVLRRRRDGDGTAVGRELIARAMLELAVVGWSGVTAADFVPDAPPEPVAFDPALVPALLDAEHNGPLVSDLLGAVTALLERLRDRAEAAEKN